MRSAAPIAQQKVAAGYAHHTCLSLSHVDEVTTTREEGGHAIARTSTRVSSCLVD
jgi:hypothetical protein